MGAKTLTTFAIIATLFAVTVKSLPRHNDPIETRQNTAGPMVFAHYMIVFQPKDNDYTNDINLAKEAGIDAFAVNYEGPDWTLTGGWLTKFYQQAQDLNFKLFLSLDTTSILDVNIAVNVTKTFSTWDSQLKIDGKVMLSSFSVNPPAWDWQVDVIDKIGQPVLFLPGDITETSSGIPPNDANFGHFTWIHPASPAVGEPVNGMLTEQSIDEDFAAWRTADKPWMAGIAPYYFRRLVPDNWLNAQDDTMWLDRWLDLLKLKPNFIEIITWNDFGESSYIGPPDSTPAAALAAQAEYYGNLPHTAFYAMAKMFIKAYKNGDTEVKVQPEDEDVFLMYRLQPAETNGAEDTQDWQGLPKNVSSIKDDVFIFSFLTSEATINVQSGGKTSPVVAPAGVSKNAIPWELGAQSITASRPLHYGQLQKTGPVISDQVEHYTGNVFAI